MRIMPVKAYNAWDMARWEERVTKWRSENSHNIIPQIAFVGFRKKNGEFKESGFVAFDENSAYYTRTKKEARQFIDNHTR